MTTLDDAPTTTALAPGWLHHSWMRQLADADPRASDRHLYMVETRLADVLEPFVLAADPSDRSDTDDAAPHHSLLVRFDGVGPEAANALLDELPDVALQRSYSTYAPSPRKLLTAVAHANGTVTCGGDLASPALVTGGMRLWTLTVHDPALLDAEPDLVPGALPTWLDSLAPDAQIAYLDGRQECLDHGLRRQAWIRVATSYGIGGARRLPDTDVLTDSTGTPTGLRFQW